MIDSLITDRTADDAQKALNLSKLQWSEMSDAQKAEWSGSLKGSYNASDLNRVENAVAYLAETLRLLRPKLQDYAKSLDVGWDVFFAGNYDPEDLNLETKTDWTKEDAPTAEAMERYLANVVTLRNALNYATDRLPSSMRNLTWQGANAIERALKGLDAAIKEFRTTAKLDMENAAQAWFYSGDIYTGEV